MMTRRFGAAIGLAALVSLPSCQRFDDRMELKKGHGLYTGRKFEEAIVAYSNVRSTSPDYVRAALGIAYTYMSMYKFGSTSDIDRELADNSIAAFDKYLQVRPPESKVEPSREFPGVNEIEERIITLLIDSRQFENAIARMESKLVKAPDDPAILSGIAKAYDRWNKPTVAIKWYLKWAAKFPKEESPHVSIGQYAWDRSYRHHKQMDDLERNRWVDIGLDAVDAALRINPNYFEALTYKNLLLRERAKMRTDPDDIAAYLGQANELLAQAKTIKARRDAEEKAKAEAQAKADGATEDQGGNAT